MSGFGWRQGLPEPSPLPEVGVEGGLWQCRGAPHRLIAAGAGAGQRGAGQVRAVLAVGFGTRISSTSLCCARRYRVHLPQVRGGRWDVG